MYVCIYVYTPLVLEGRKREEVKRLRERVRKHILTHTYTTIFLHTRGTQALLKCEEVKRNDAHGHRHRH